MEVNNLTVNNYSFWDFKGPEEYLDKWFMMGTPLPILATLGIYLLFVLKIGPAFMKNREPYDLKTSILIYNALQVLYSLYLFQYGIQMIWRHGSLVHAECFIANDQFKYTILRGHYFYFLAKVSELLDTIFFVLRKKWNQVSFLHVYHHFIMCLSTWMSLKYEPSDSLIFLGTLNSFVHVIMYAYYGLSAFPGLRKYLWWKKYITKMQLVQFVMVLLQIQLSSIISECPLSYILLALCYAHGFLFIYLFANFYIKNYINKRRGQNSKMNKQASQSKNDLNSSNDEVLEGGNNKVPEKVR